MRKYDAIIVGSGPNGFAAAITLQRQGLSTLIIEGADTVGGGMRSKELCMSNVKHDICSAIHPMVMASPFFQSLPLEQYGLRFVHPKYLAAHPLDYGKAGLLSKDIVETAEGLGDDKYRYLTLLRGLVDSCPDIINDTMGPLRFPKNMLNLFNFGIRALPAATCLSKVFKDEKAKALWAGMVGHSMQPLSNWATSAYGLMLMMVGHKCGWPIPVGGSQSIADALLFYYKSLGGEVQTSFWVKDIQELPEHKLLFLDMNPKQIVALKGLKLKEGYRRQLEKYKQGMGVFKMDWILSEPVPFTNLEARQAGTVHLGGAFDEIAYYERETYRGRVLSKPFVLFTQPSVFDQTRIVDGKHIGWAYCHVPNGATYDYSKAIENQIERFAPGFKDTIITKHSFSPIELERYNPNYIGGDINGGLMDITQLYTRPIPSLTPYRTSNSQVYICSSATPPGGGVHGMCGYHAARVAMKDHFDIIL